MTKKILLIIIFILIILGIVGSLYFITYKNDSEAKLENVNEMSSIPENITNSSINDENIVSNEVENNTSNEIEKTTVEENTITETSNENSEVVEDKKETQTTASSSTKANSNPSNNNSKTKETVKQSTTTSTTTTQSSSSQNNKKEETKTEPKVERCTNNHNHFIDVGNSGKWFNSKNEAIALYNEKIKYWGEKWENFEIDNDTYYKNCPSGYEVWDCMYCGKWTINFYYR